MPIGEQRLYNFEPGSSAYDLRLVEVQQKIRAGAAKFEQQLCAHAGITTDRLHELLESYTIGEVDAAITQWGPTFKSHLGQAGPAKPEDPRAPGWCVQWEIEQNK